MAVALSILISLNIAHVPKAAAEEQIIEPMNWNGVQSLINGASDYATIDLSKLESPSTGGLFTSAEFITIKIPRGKSLTIKGKSGTTFKNTAFVFEGDNNIIIEDLNVQSANNHNGTTNGGGVAYAPLYFSYGENILTLRGVNNVTSGQSSVADNYGAALNVNSQASLTITEDTHAIEASLNATGGARGAGIGGGERGGSGSIAISGGTVNAKGGSYAPGIGAGGSGGTIDSITIADGIVTATGADGAAGIGLSSGTGGQVNNITISGGSITAKGAYRSIFDGGGAGIGSGAGTDGKVGSIAITGGSVAATGESGSAGVGGGNNSGGIDTVRVTGGIITATAGSNGAGIGGGNRSGPVGNITIDGGTITATGGSNGKGIGNGNNSAVGSIIINGGSVKALDSKSATSVFPSPSNSAGYGVYLNTLTIPSHINEYVAAGSLNGVDFAGEPNAQAGIYGIHDVKTLPNDIKTNGVLYFYLPTSGEVDEEILVTPASITYGTYGASYVRGNHDSNAQTLAETLKLEILSPETGGTPQKELSGAMYTGAITWHDVTNGGVLKGKFAGETVYKASVELRAINSYSWPPTYVMVDGGSVSNTKVNGTGVGNTLTFDVEFPATAAGEVEDDPESVPDPGPAPGSNISISVVVSIWNELNRAIESAIQERINLGASSITIDLSQLRPTDEVTTVSIPKDETVTIKGVAGKTFDKVAFRFEGNNKITIENLQVKSDDQHKSTYDARQGPAPLYFVSGDNALVFKGENIITSGHTTLGQQGYGAAVGISFGSNLTISGAADDANASLTANGGVSGAGIGGGESNTVGNIAINSGRIIANGGRFAPGIGAGGSNGIMSGITINGGVITANGGSSLLGSGGGAGIGLSASDATSDLHGQIDRITINGGTVEAVGGPAAAGIGTGPGSSGTIGSIKINGGTITATGGNRDGILLSGGGAGIGIGRNDSGSIGNISIAGGQIVATGGQGSAGIGGGPWAKNAVDSILISGGTITAKGGSDGNGIGKGSDGVVGEITIDGGSVQATNSNSVTSVSPRPVNSAGQAVYLNTLTVLRHSDQYVAAASINGVDCADLPDAQSGVYGIKDVRMLPNDSKVNGNLYFYLPPSGEIEEEVLVTPSSNNYGAYGARYIRRSHDENAQTLAETIKVNIVAPKTGEAPQTAVSDVKFTGTITWYNKTNGGEDFAGSTFAGNTKYSATVKLKSLNTYSWPTTMYISVNGTVSNMKVTGTGAGNNLTFDVEFPATEFITLGDQSIVMKAPVIGETPQAEVADGDGFTGTSLTWYDETNGGVHNGVFASGTVYRAAVVLTSGDNYKWPLIVPSITVDGGVVTNITVDELGRELTFDVVFPMTPTVTAPDGSTITDNGDSTVTVELPSGSTVTVPSGSNVTDNEDGTVTVEVPSGPTVTVPEGSTVTDNEDGTVTVEVPSGPTVTVPGGSTVTDNEDGTVTIELPSGSTVTVPDGSVVTDNGDGTVTIELPSGSTVTVPNGSVVTDNG
ncbi:hypothetical protein DMN77_18250, partial [Paenibacillus sp. 79R4]|nr:hypothetical protein [Paenibacillus sp. 79R4]